MRISAKSRYAVAALTVIAQKKQANPVPLVTLSKQLGISKIYLEQVFGALKKNNIVVSVKGAKGGYSLVGNAEDITMYDILKATEIGLFEILTEPVSDKMPQINQVLEKHLYEPLDKGVFSILQSISLDQLAKELSIRQGNSDNMFYI